MFNNFKIFHSQAGPLSGKGSGGLNNIQKVGVDASTPPGTNPVVADANNEIFVTGGQVAAGTTTNVIRTDSLAANTFTIEVQRSQAVAASTIGDNGVCHFNSAQFTVDANGFVSSLGSAFHYVQTSAALYIATANDFYISCDSSANTITIQLPDNPTQFREFIIKDRTGKAALNNIFVTTVSGIDLIDGFNFYTLDSNYFAVSLLWNGSSYEVY